MNSRNTVIIWIVLSTIAVAQGSSHAGTKARNHIYSNVEYNEEGGDLLGYEIEFIANGPRVTGVLRIYQGGCGEPVPLTGELTDGKIALGGESRSYGVVKISATIIQGHMSATIRIEKSAKPETVKLQAAAKAHC
jgi:hypothetical protein